MVETKTKIKSFYDLDAWREGHKLVLMVYEITKIFPQAELFGLVSQMNRAAVSITSNIAEGFSRFTPRDKCQFYTMSLGSLTELQSEATVAKDNGYISIEKFNEFFKQSVIVAKLLNGLKRIGKIQNTRY